MPPKNETLLVDGGPAPSLKSEFSRAPGPSLPADQGFAAIPSLGDTPSPADATAHDGRLRTGSGLPPGRFGDYEILAPIARGGMGMVYKARQIKLNRTVALKTILDAHCADDLALRRFYAEAEAAAALDHPNIVPIYEVGEHDGQQFFSMAFVEGGSLEDFVAGGPATDLEAATIMQGVAEAIAYAHERNIIHRDLKPANILLHVSRCDGALRAREGDRLAAVVPKVTDFGIARRIDGDSHLTATGQVLGTPSFMSPEQAAGHPDDVGKPSDIFSLGTILYYLLTGRAPFDGESLIATLRNVVDRDPEPPSRLRPSVCEELESICLKCLEKDLSRRYGSARELADELARFLAGEAVQAGSGRERAGTRRRTWHAPMPLVFCGAAVVLTVLLAAILAMTYQGHTANIPKESTPTGAAEGGQVRGDAKGEQGTRVLSESELRDALKEARREKQRAEEQERALARERLELAHRSAYNLHLERAAHLIGTDRGRAAAFLDDVQNFPAERREFTWRYLKRLASSASDPTTEASAIQTSTLLEMKDAGQVVGVAFAPDGATVAVGTTKPQSIICVYDLPSGKLRHKLSGHTGPVAFLGFGSDSRSLYSCDSASLKVWDATTGEELPPRIEHPTDATALDCSPDGDELVTLGDDHVLRFWNLRTGRLGTSHRVAADDSGFCVAWTSRGTLLARVEGNSIRVIDAHSGEERFVVPGIGGKIFSLLITSDARLLVVHEERQLAVWRLDTAEMVADLPVQSIAASPDSQTLVGVDEEGMVQFWDPWTGQVRASFPGHAGRGFLARFSPNGDRLLTTAFDKTARVWEALPEAPSQTTPVSLPFHAGG